MLIVALLATLIGLSLGLLGGGGSILAVPVLAYVGDLPAKEAIATSLVVVGATSVFALIPTLAAATWNGAPGLFSPQPPWSGLTWADSQPISLPATHSCCSLRP